MKNKMLSAMATIALIGFVTTAQAQHEEQADRKMDMSQMQGMMHTCMESHKDGKMCNEDMMTKCQEKMSKSECQKMMKQAKAHDTKTKKK